MDVAARLEALEHENARLRDELDVLKDTLGLHFVAPPQFRLTGSETKVFGRLLRGGLANRDALMASLYRDAARDEAEIKIIDVFICKLRRKLSPFGLTIETVWGQGWLMTPATIADFETRWPAGAHAEAA